MGRSVLIVALLLGAARVVVAGDGWGDLRQRAVIGREARLLAVQGVAVLPDGAVLVADRLDYRVKKFAVSGKQAAAVGGRGRGPGQFQGPGPLDACADRIAVADFASDRIQLLGNDLTPSVSFHAPGAVSDLCFDGRGNLWVMALTADGKPGLVLYDGGGRQRKAVRLRNAVGDPFLHAGFVIWVGKGMLAVSYYVQNKVELWDTTGKFIREFPVPGVPARARPVIGSRSRVAVPDGCLFRSATADGGGLIYLLAGDYSDRPGQEVMVMDTKGAVRGRLLLAERCVLIRADGRGSLYAVPRMRDSIVRYRLAER